MKKKEIWKQCRDFPDYEVSSKGRLKNKHGRILKTFLSKKGYIRINMYNESGRLVQYLHRLVAIAFIPNPENKPEINHKDKNKANNKVENLEWSSRSENMKNCFKDTIPLHKILDVYKNNPGISVKKFEELILKT